MNEDRKAADDWKRADTDWFRDCRWGVFTHYLTGPETTADEWRRQVDGFEDYTAGELAGELAVGGFGLGDNPALCRFGPIRRWVDQRPRRSGYMGCPRREGRADSRSVPDPVACLGRGHRTSREESARWSVT